MRIQVISDAWHPQTNGVVRTLERLMEEGRKAGYDMDIVAPQPDRSLPCPTYPEIRLAVDPLRRVRKAMDRFQPDAIHIATEGPLGLAARYLSRRRGFRFTTSYHTRFPEYLSARLPVPLRWGYAYMRWFHCASAGVMVATPSLEKELSAAGFERLCGWTRGVDTDLFRPDLPNVLKGLPRPLFMYVGRVAVEKNISAFLELDLPGSKVVVGDGPQLSDLQGRFPDAVFTGAQYGQDLANHYASADCFVFPSRTDTFGLVLLEAMACGVPVAAYPVPGPLDVVGPTNAGILSEDLKTAAMQALKIPRENCRQVAERSSWRNCTEIFVKNLVPI